MAHVGCGAVAAVAVVSLDIAAVVAVGGSGTRAGRPTDGLRSSAWQRHLPLAFWFHLLGRCLDHLGYSRSPAGVSPRSYAHHSRITLPSL